MASVLPTTLVTMHLNTCRHACRISPSKNASVSTSLAISDGHYERLRPDRPAGHCNIPLPEDVLRPTDPKDHTQQAFFGFMYGESRKIDDASDDEWLERSNHYPWSTAVLVRRNDQTTDINHRLLDILLPGEHAMFLIDTP